MKHLFIILGVIILFSFTKKEEPISEWRGPNRGGVYPETGLLKQWPEAGPELLWAIDSTGRGYGSPVVAGDLLFITGEIDSTSYLYAYNLSGKLIWKSVCGNEWVKNFPGSRSTPTVVGDLIYVCSGKGDIGCFDKTSGSKKWSLNMVSDLQGTNNMFGYSQSHDPRGVEQTIAPGFSRGNASPKCTSPQSGRHIAVPSRSRPYLHRRVILRREPSEHRGTPRHRPLPAENQTSSNIAKTARRQPPGRGDLAP
jgi:hypothetical protein